MICVTMTRNAGLHGCTDQGSIAFSHAKHLYLQMKSKNLRPPQYWVPEKRILQTLQGYVSRVLSSRHSHHPPHSVILSAKRAGRTCRKRVLECVKILQVVREDFLGDSYYCNTIRIWRGFAYSTKRYCSSNLFLLWNRGALGGLLPIYPGHLLG